MADTAIAITAGAGTNVDTRTEATNGNHRQVIVIGDPSTNAGVAPVDATNGLTVDAATVTTVLGEVQASPTSNTVLDRLKTLNSSIAAKGTQANPSADYISVVAAGEVASGTADSGNPVKIGMKAKAGLSGVTLATADNRFNAHGALDGAIYTHPHCGLEDIVTGNASTTGATSTACITAQAAGIKTYLTSIALCNSSATNITVNILDGVTVKYTLSVPANSGNNKEFTIPIPGSAATAWNFQASSGVTTLTCSMIGFKSKI